MNTFAFYDTKPYDREPQGRSRYGAIAAVVVHTPVMRKKNEEAAL